MDEHNVSEPIDNFEKELDEYFEIELNEYIDRLPSRLMEKHKNDLRYFVTSINPNVNIQKLESFLIKLENFGKKEKLHG